MSRIAVDHVGNLRMLDSAGATLHQEAEVFSEPWNCKLEHEHGPFCGVDRGYVVRRTFERVEFRLKNPGRPVAGSGTEVVMFDYAYREVLGDLSKMDAQQLNKRFEETEAKWLELSERVEAMRAEIARRKAGA